MSSTDPSADPCAYQAPEQYSQGYHIGAVFVILAASLLGTGIPIVSHHFPAFAQRNEFVCSTMHRIS